MDNPCKTCQRQGDCDHYFRCARWRAWFSKQWRRIQQMLQPASFNDADNETSAGTVFSDSGDADIKQ